MFIICGTDCLFTKTKYIPYKSVLERSVVFLMLEKFVLFSATQTLRRHAVKMVSSCSQYSESDCVESHPVHTDNTPKAVHSSTPSKCNKNMSFLSPLNASFQSTSTVYTDDHNDPDYLPDESHSDTDEECHEQ